jgi:hypothetical protein
MFIERAYAEREKLSDRDLARLHASLLDEVQQYEFIIRNYPQDRMEKHGKPHLALLRQKVADVNATILARTNSSGHS